MGSRADLHLHSRCSDGVLSPRDIVTRARARGLGAISLTDHDHTGAIAEAVAAGDVAGIDVIPGIELTAMREAQEVHLLGYFIDPAHAGLQGFLAEVRRGRRIRAERMVERLHRARVPVRLDAVLEQAGDGAIGRPHVAHAMVSEGLAGSYQEAFLRYLAPGRPGYEEKGRIGTDQVLQIIKEAGGLSFIAHPGILPGDAIVLELINEGVDGIEVVHPSHTPQTERRYRGIAEQFFLLMSGGSDYHGGGRSDEDAFGKFTISSDHITAMRRALSHADGPKPVAGERH